MKVLSIRYGIAHIPNPLCVKVTEDNSTNYTIRIGVGRWPTQIIRPEYPSRTRLDPKTNHREILGAEFT